MYDVGGADDGGADAPDDCRVSLQVPVELDLTPGGDLVLGGVAEDSLQDQLATCVGVLDQLDRAEAAAQHINMYMSVRITYRESTIVTFSKPT